MPRTELTEGSSTTSFPVFGWIIVEGSPITENRSPTLTPWDVPRSIKILFFSLAGPEMTMPVFASKSSVILFVTAISAETEVQRKIKITIGKNFLFMAAFSLGVRPGEENIVLYAVTENGNASL